MRSKWFELKPAVFALRRNGKSLSFIEANLGIPRSTLSGWCKEIALTDVQRQRLNDNKARALVEARLVAAQRHRDQKEARLQEAKDQAANTLASLSLTPHLVELALAMLYWGEGKKAQTTALGSSDPKMLVFFLNAVKVSYSVERTEVVCELHLRRDQDEKNEVSYWSKQLGVPAGNFKRIYFDRRTRAATYEMYHGVCVIYCPGIALQRKLVYLYKSFSNKVTESLGD